MNSLVLISLIVIINIILVLGLENSDAFAVGDRK